MTPALSRSPRSTRGTTRTIAYWKGLRDGIGRLDEEGPRGTKATAEVLAVRATLGVGVADRAVRGEPFVGHELDDRADEITIQPRCQAPVGVDERTGMRPEDVGPAVAKRTAGMSLWIAPRVVDEQGRAMVDE